MTEENRSVAEAIEQAAHIISNNGSSTFAIEGLAEAVHRVADQMARIADSIEGQKNA